MTSREFTAIFTRAQAHWHQRPLDDAALGLYLAELADFPAAHVEAAVEALIRDGRAFIPLAGEIRRKIVELELDAPPWVNAVAMLRQARRDREAFVYPDTCIDGVEGCDGMGTVIGDEPQEVQRRQPCACAKTAKGRERLRKARATGDFGKCPKGQCDGTGRVTVTVTEIHEVARACSCREKLRELARPNLHPVVRQFVLLVGWPQIEDWLVSGSATIESQMRVKYEQVVNAAIEDRSLVGVREESLAKVKRANLGQGEGLPQLLSGSVREVLATIPSEAA